MQVDGDRAVELAHAAQDQLLAGLGGERHDGVGDGGTVELGGVEGVEVRDALRGGHVDDLVGERDELGALGDEVGLGVELDHDAVLDGDQALGGGALGALTHVLGTLDAQDLDGLVEVAVGLLQGLLAVHHPGAGELTQTLDVGSGVVRHCGATLLKGVRDLSGKVLKSRSAGEIVSTLDVGASGDGCPPLPTPRARPPEDPLGDRGRPGPMALELEVRIRPRWPGPRRGPRPRGPRRRATRCP